MTETKNETIDVGTLKQQAEEWATKNIGKNFQFRKGQLESIVYTLNNILNRNIETSVLQMPTGSGKSLTCIIAAGVLAKYYGMKSYILASDLYLWQQYADMKKGAVSHEEWLAMKEKEHESHE